MSFRERYGLRVSYRVSRQVFAVPGSASLLLDLDDADLASWTGAGTLVEPYPAAPRQVDAEQVTVGARWGTQHSVTCAAIETPHRAGWRPLLCGEFDLAYSPLMELDYGLGRVVWSQLDLEDQAPLDPAAAPCNP